MNIYKLGWDEKYKKIPLKSGQFISRVMSKSNKYYIYFEGINIEAKLSGKYRFNAKEQKDYPSVGDFVIISLINEKNAIIHKLIPRITSLARKTPISGGRKLKNNKIDGGKTEEQILASNIDVVFIVTSLDSDFNISRIERYITVAYNSGAKPVIILNKIDKCKNVDTYVEKVQSVALGIDILPLSAQNNENIKLLDKYLKPRNTVVFIGSSGVGKSTITNKLIGTETIKTQEISSITKKGKHTTSRADCYIHPSGYIIIDTPGLRELQLWGNEEVLKQSFEDIYNISLKCKFNDCSHTKEPGCAIKEAINNNELSVERYESYLTQQNELNTLSKKQREFKKNIARINKRNRLNI